MGNPSERLILFCKKHKKIACYGAANYGHTVKHYLESIGMKVDCFVVTKNETGCQSIDGIPLCEITRLPVDIDQYGIILSLTSMFHKKVADILLGKGVAKENIFPVDYRIWKCMYDSLLNSKRWNCLMVHPYNLGNGYSERAKFLDDKYVELQVEDERRFFRGTVCNANGG